MKKNSLLIFLSLIICSCSNSVSSSYSSLNSDTFSLTSSNQESSSISYGWKEDIYTENDSSLDYVLYYPKIYVEGCTSMLPLIVFVPDSSYVNSSFTQYEKSACPTN
jgi:hypothetical protein